MPARQLAPLLLLAVAAIAAAVLVGASASDPVAPEPPGRPTPPGQPGRGQPRPADGPADTAVALAVGYALAARNWSAASYPANWRARLALSDGRLRRELIEARPPAGELAVLRTERARSWATLSGAERDPDVAVPRAVVRVGLYETVSAAGQTVRGPTANRVELRRVAGRWRVVGFSLIPGGAL